MMADASRPVSLGDRAARGSGVVLAGQAAKALLQFGSLIVLARLLSPSDFGLVAMVTAVIGVADLIRDFGLSSAAIQAKTLSNDERTNLFWVNVAFGGLCTALVCAATPLIQVAYDRPELGPIVLSLSSVFLFSGINTQYRADLTRSMRYPALAAADITSQAVALAVAVACAIAGFGFWAIVAQQITAAVVALTMNVLSTRWWPGRYRRGVPLRRFFRFGSSLFATQALTYATKNADNVAIGIIYGDYQLGLYSRAYQLLMAPLNQINAPMTGVALPVLSRIQDDDVRFGHYLKRAQLVACYLTATVFAVAAGLADPLVRLLFGEIWQPVAAIFAVLAVGGVFRSIQQIAYWTYLSKGRTGAQLRMILVTRPVMIAIILGGLPWGPLGVAVGHSVAYFLFWIVSTLHVGRVTGVDARGLISNALPPLLLVSLPAGLLAFAATLLPVVVALQLVVGLAAAIAYGALIALVSRRVRSDLRLLRGFVGRAMGRSGAR